MVRRCIVHFGPAKTGSSSIQQTLFHELRDPRFEYAALGVANHNRVLVTAFSTEPELFPNHRRNGLSAEEVWRMQGRLRKKFRSAISLSTAETVIISGEALPSLEPEALTDLRQDLEASFDRVIAVGYARPPMGFMNSSYQQRIKSELETLEGFRIYSNYRRKFQKLDTVFGRENVLIWRFAAADFPEGDVVRHFFDSLGINQPAKVRRVNESLSLPAVQAFYAYHKLADPVAPGRGVPASRMAAARVLSALSGGKFRLGSNLVRPVIEANRDDIAWAEERIGASLAEPDGDDAGAIRNEADMLNISAGSIAALEELIGTRTELPSRIEDRPLHAARLVQALIESLAEVSEGKLGERTRRERQLPGRRKDRARLPGRLRARDEEA